MATSSITTNISIQTSEQAERLIRAFETCAKGIAPSPSMKDATFVSEPDKIRELMAKRKQQK